jgi:hypothetical protein
MGIVKAHEKSLPGPDEGFSQTTWLELYRVKSDIHHYEMSIKNWNGEIARLEECKKEAEAKIRNLILDRDRIIQNENKILFRKHSKWWAEQVATDVIVNCSEHQPCPECRMKMRKSYTDKVIYWNENSDKAIRRTFYWACEKCGYREEIPDDDD